MTSTDLHWNRRTLHVMAGHDESRVLRIGITVRQQQIQRIPLLWFDVGCSDYLGPFFRIIRNELSEFGRRERKR